MRSKDAIVAGVDGCRAGWVVATGVVDPVGIRAVSVACIETFEEIFDGGYAVIAVDIPIGLPERAEPGGRSADRAARTMLGARRSSVFSPPIRALLGSVDYRDALCVMRASSEHGLGLTKQCWNIIPKIREVDEIIRRTPDAGVYECHPEVCFCAMAGRPMTHRKASPEGAVERQGVLHDAGIEPQVGPIRGAKIDDILDAHACLWTAARIQRGESRQLPAEFEFDGAGVPMRIVY